MAETADLLEFLVYTERCRKNLQALLCVDVTLWSCWRESSEGNGQAAENRRTATVTQITTLNNNRCEQNTSRYNNKANLSISFKPDHYFFFLFFIIFKYWDCPLWQLKSFFLIFFFSLSALHVLRWLWIPILSLSQLANYQLANYWLPINSLLNYNAAAISFVLLSRISPSHCTATHNASALYFTLFAWPHLSLALTVLLFTTFKPQSALTCLCVSIFGYVFFALKKRPPAPVSTQPASVSGVPVNSDIWAK